MEIIFWIAQTLIAIIGLLSIICVGLSLFNPTLINLPKSPVTLPVRSSRIRASFTKSPIFVILCLFGWGVVFYNGVYAIFWFLPENLGGQTENGWLTLRNSISGAGASILVTAVIIQLNRFASLEQKSKSTDKEQADA